MYFIIESGTEIKSSILYNSVDQNDIELHMLQIAATSGIQIMSSGIPNITPDDNNYVKIINKNCILIFKPHNTGWWYDSWSLQLWKKIEVVWHDITNIKL
jgi:hypothetical protein